MYALILINVYVFHGAWLLSLIYQRKAVIGVASRKFPDTGMWISMRHNSHINIPANHHDSCSQSAKIRDI